MKIKVNEDVHSAVDLEVELQNLLPGLSNADAHDYAKELWVASKRGSSVSKRTGSASKGVGSTVKIGAQTWTAANLDIDDGGEGIYKNPDNNETYYTWDAAMRVAESIPGWHLPSAIEWNEAALACGATERPYTGNSNRNDYRDVQELKDELGVKPAGRRVNSSFNDVGRNAYFWTATESSTASAYSRFFSAGTLMDSYSNYKTSFAYSVRLVKD